MELFRSVLGGGDGAGGHRHGSSANHGAGPSSAETIERLVDRLSNATLLEDRRDACRALRAMSRKFRVEVGVQAQECMIGILEADRADEEILGYALDTLCNVCSPEEFEEEEDGIEDGVVTKGVGEQFTEIYLKHGSHNVQLVLDLLEEFDFKVRRPAIKLLTHLLLNKPREMQELILASHLGVSRLMDVLVDTREVLRNDCLLLLIQLTKGNANLQKIVAFENCFDKLVDIIVSEGYSDGGIVVEDCLRLMLNLLRNNASNQTFFREGSYIQRVTPFFDLTLDEDEVEVGWSAQKVSNMLHMLMSVRTLVSPSNPTNVTSSCQKTILSCGLLEKLCSILLAAGIPADILTETINTISEVIRGHLSSQQFFARIEAPSAPPRPALILLLMSMVNEKQPFALRCAVLYCFQCYLQRNPGGQAQVMATLLPSNQNEAPRAAEVTAGQLLCGGLFSADRLSNWFASVALSHGLMEHENLKSELLRVQLSTTTGNEPVSLLLQCFTILQHSPNMQTKLGNLMLLCVWVDGCSVAVAQLLAIPSLIPFLTGQIGSNEHDEMERLSQGVCAFLLGLCILHNDNKSTVHTQDSLYQLIEKRIGYEVFMDKLGEVSKHEAYNKALKQPQLRSQDAAELIFDHKFCHLFKHLEHGVVHFMTKRRENSGMGDESDPTIVKQYKDVIREQDVKIRERDARIGDLTNANLYLQQELAAGQQTIEELNATIQTLRDLNSVLKAQQQPGAPPPPAAATAAVSNGPTSSPVPSDMLNGPSSNHLRVTEESRKAVERLEKELKIRDDIIHELEMRLAETSSPSSPTSPGPVVVNGPVELEMLHSQVQVLQDTVGRKESRIDQLEAELGRMKVRGGVDSNGEAQKAAAELAESRTQLASVRGEMEDLLMLLADQAAKIEEYQSRLRGLGVYSE